MLILCFQFFVSRKMTEPFQEILNIHSVSTTPLKSFISCRKISVENIFAYFTFSHSLIRSCSFFFASFFHCRTNPGVAMKLQYTLSHIIYIYNCNCKWDYIPINTCTTARMRWSYFKYKYEYKYDFRSAKKTPYFNFTATDNININNNNNNKRIFLHFFRSFSLSLLRM